VRRLYLIRLKYPKQILVEPNHDNQVHGLSVLALIDSATSAEFIARPTATAVLEPWRSARLYLNPAKRSALLCDNIVPCAVIKRSEDIPSGSEESCDYPGNSCGS
jgi:hypothetical protein